MWVQYSPLCPTNLLHSVRWQVTGFSLFIYLWVSKCIFHWNQNWRQKNKCQFIQVISVPEYQTFILMVDTPLALLTDSKYSSLISLSSCSSGALIFFRCVGTICSMFFSDDRSMGATLIRSNPFSMNSLNCWWETIIEHTFKKEKKGGLWV